ITRGLFKDKPDTANGPVQEFIYERPSFKQHFRGYKAGLITFPEQAVNIDPYFFGLWLGDGCCRKPLITNMDPEVIEFVSEYAQKIGAGTTVSSKKDCKAVSINIRFHDKKNNPL